MNRSAIGFVLLGVACAAQPVDDVITHNSGGSASGGSTAGGGGKGGSGGSLSSAGTVGSLGGSLSAGSGGTSSTAGKGGGAGSTTETGDGGAMTGEGGTEAAQAGTGGTGASGGPGRIDQKDITAHYEAIETGTASPVQHIYGKVKVVNMGGGNAYLKDTRVRYYFTNELAPTVPQFEIQLHQLTAPNITSDIACVGTLVKMPNPTATADTYIEFTFPNDAQLLDSGKTALIQVRIFDPAPTQPKFDQSNDYSYNAKMDSTDKITVYYKTNIIWGNEPQ
jgi:hypothetical protein